MDRIEAITVCVGYSDFLQAVLPFNLGAVDRLVVVTSPDDTATRELCRRAGAECLASEDGTRGGDDFAKGRLVERGLQHLSAEGWRLHLDADIALPLHFRRQLEAAHLDESCVHGWDRVMVKGWEQWRKLLSSGWLDGRQWDVNHLPFPAGFEVGARWASPKSGWLPIGHGQMWHSSADEWRGSRVRGYPHRHGNACRTDVQHALQWDRRKRVLVPEVVVAHLESEPCPAGANWRGRTTKPFGPPAGATVATCPHWY